MTIHNGKFEPITESSTRILESGDTRITEASDVRIVDSTTYNTGTSTFIVTPRVIPFYSRMYIKVNSLWKESVASVKSSGVWTYSLKMYNKVNGLWKRVK